MEALKTYSIDAVVWFFDVITSIACRSLGTLRCLCREEGFPPRYAAGFSQT
jgi:hypothetical protein